MDTLLLVLGWGVCIADISKTYLVLLSNSYDTSDSMAFTL